MKTKSPTRRRMNFVHVLLFFRSGDHIDVREARGAIWDWHSGDRRFAITAERALTDHKGGKKEV